MQMKWLNLDEIKNSSIYFTPNLPVIATKRYKVSLLKGMLYITLFTLASWFLLILILSTTPLKDMLFVVDNTELKVQNEKIQLLQKRVIILTQQLQDISSTTERMKYAIRLGVQDSINPKNPLYDTLKKPIKKKLSIEGNIFHAFQLLITQIFDEQQEKIIFFEPIRGIITQEFNAAKGHLGIDYGIKPGSPIYSAAGGLVTFADYTVESGYMMMIQHGNDYITIYKHCSSLLKKTRDIVNQGELIALSGNSGYNTTGPHLHFEVWHKGKPIDPKTIFLN
jgi:murein DD-endopeptidase MepM/ murein hydrolase activator NlpD